MPSLEEIKQILKIQKNRCFYCNRKFGRERQPTKDHLLCGGPHCALNIVMACLSCNSRRCDIPFRTYCKLLSTAQNKRILLCLSKRLLCHDFEKLGNVPLDAFLMALEEHNPKHWRYRNILSVEAFSRRNAGMNRLLPSTGAQILKRAFPRN